MIQGNGADTSARGEVEITLGGRKMKMRPSWAAIDRIEGEIGSLVLLYRRSRQQEWSVRDLVTVVAAGLEAGGEPVNRDKVGELIVAAGCTEVWITVGTFLNAALTGGADPDDFEGEPGGKAEAAQDQKDA